MNKDHKYNNTASSGRYQKRLIGYRKVCALLYVFLFFAFSSSIYAQVSNGTTGEWTDNSIWVGGSAPPTVDIQTDVTINGYVTSDVGLSTRFNRTLLISIVDTLVVNGDLLMGFKGDLSIGSNGLLIVLGDYTSQNQVNVVNGGKMIVTGKVTIPNGSADFTNSGALYVFDIVNSSFGNNSPDLVCDPITDCVFDSTILATDDPDLNDFFNEVADPCFGIPSQPTITAGSATTFCDGGSVILTSSAEDSYLWSTGETTQSITVSTSSSLTVQVSDINGCVSLPSAPESVTVNPLPVATITPGGATTFCAGGSVTLSSNAAASYLWSTGATTQDITVTTTSSPTVTITDGNGCVSLPSAAEAVTVNALPVATITPGGATTFCAGGSVTLSANAAASYLWSTGATTQDITVTTSSSPTVTITDGNGCVSLPSAAEAVTVNALPVATITPSGATTFCDGGSVTLSANAAASYLWSTGATTQDITVTTTSSPTVTITDGNGCVSLPSAAEAVTVNAL
ncbi:MAG: hypothetical protein K9H12_11705, partial [Bacteroidales bacterium]|nr:hypothetical protein [Bacteroidales bacterium]